MDALAQMKLLVGLAQIDGKVADRERYYILNIGRANGVYPDQINPLFEQAHTMAVPADLTGDEKFDYLYTLVQLMKIDERMYQEEIRYCSEVATRLGYTPEVMFDMMLHVRSSGLNKAEISDLKQLAQKHLIR